MNYRHHFHAGNFADVVKHALLVQLVRGMQRKPNGCLFLDTHAGRGGYDLARAEKGDSLARRSEHPDGIGRLWARADLPPPVEDYMRLVRDFDRTMSDGGLAPRFYPGSPRLLRLLARPQDRLVFCEKHPDECEELRTSFAGDRRVSVRAMDGYQAPGAMLPPPERRALVLLDPPFEDAGEGIRIAGALRDGLRRLPGGTYAVWYPLTGRVRVDEFVENIAALSLPPTLIVETVVNPESPRMRGCGLLIVNPPWQFEGEAAPMARYLAAVLAQAPAANATLRWLVPE